MNAHPTSETLHAYARGRLAPAMAIDVDSHTRDCAVCRAALSASADPTAMRRTLARVEREGGHLAYEELSALADGKLAAQRRTVVERHLKICARCSREWADMQQFAPALSRPLRVKAEASQGLVAGLRRWLQSNNGMRAVAAGVVAATAAALVLSGRVGPTGGDAGSSGPSVSATFGGSANGNSGVAQPTPGSMSGVHSIFDQTVFDRLDRIAPEAVTAYRNGDLAAVAKALKPRAARGEAGAAHALGLLYAEGRGVPEDRAQATALLKQAAAKNDAGASANLDALLASPRGSYSR